MRYWIIACVALLAGCAKEPAAYLVSGAEVSITVERTKPYFWSSGWELDLIVRRHPECQRRHHLKPAGSGNLKVELYSPERGVFILRQGKRWYVTELRECGFSAYQEPPPEPGELLGAFQEKNGTFKFVGNKDKAAGTPEGD